MSRTTALGVIPNEESVVLSEFKNSHGWASSIWSRLLKTVYGFEGSWFFDEGNELLHQMWDEIETLEDWQQVPLVLTFDTGVIPCQAYGWATEMLDEFEAKAPERPEYVNHVPAVADLLRTQPECPLFGVYGTSVSTNPFEQYNEDSDETKGIPVSEMYVLNCHKDLFAEVVK